MNPFLFHMATQLRDLRELMNWKQEDLASAIGCSRPTVIAIERDPSRLEKTAALAIFSVVAAELGERRDKLKSLSFNQWGQVDKMEGLIAALATLGLTGRFFGKSAAKIATTMVLPGVGVFAAGYFGMKGALNLISYLTKPKSDQSAPAEISPEELKDFSEKSFSLLESKVKLCLGLDKMDLREFRRKLEAGEAVKNA